MMRAKTSWNNFLVCICAYSFTMINLPYIFAGSFTDKTLHTRFSFPF